METFTINRLIKMIKSIGWYKNQWLEISKILISANDRGLKFGDGIFETILIKNNKPILLNEHIKRLKKSSELLKINFNINKKYLEHLINEGITKLSLNTNQFGSIRINYSRGISNDRSLKINRDIKTNGFDNLWLEFYQIKPNLFPISVFISEKEKRNQFSLLSKCKTFSYNQAIKVLIEANQKNYDDCLLLNTAGEVCCGSTFNLLIKRNNKWITPRKESGCLDGIMVNKALKLNVAKEELIYPKFHPEDIVIAINSLSCRQIIKINNLKLSSDFDPIYLWDLLYN